jgi:hypothetical protein
MALGLVCVSTISPLAASLSLRWTAPGGDGYRGQSNVYDLRYSTAVITDANWSQATRVNGLSKPRPYGNMESFTIAGLQPSTTYYFAIKAADASWNWSPLSNIPSKTTCPGCVGITGNIDGSAGDVVDLRDLSLLTNYLTGGTAPIQVCTEEGNIDASPDGTINLSDLSRLIAYLTGGMPLPDCP